MDGFEGNDSLEGLLVQLLRAAGLSDTRPAVDDVPVSVSEAIALLELRASDGATQAQVVDRLGLEKSTVSRLAAGLERKGWITRERNPGNQRYVRLALTQAGRAVAAHVWHTWQERHARILAALTDGERAGLAIGLGGLVRALAAEGLLGKLTPATPSREPDQRHAGASRSPGPDVVGRAGSQNRQEHHHARLHREQGQPPTPLAPHRRPSPWSGADD